METTLTPEPPKMRFIDAYAHSGIGYHNIPMVADKANVPRYVLNEMLTGKPVAPRDAEKVLTTMNTLIADPGKALTFSNVEIPVLSQDASKEVHARRGFWPPSTN